MSRKEFAPDGTEDCVKAKFIAKEGRPLSEFKAWLAKAESQVPAACRANAYLVSHDDGGRMEDAEISLWYRKAPL